MSTNYDSRESHFDKALIHAKLDDRAFITNSDIVRAFGVSARTLRRAVHEGDLICFRGTASHKGKIFYSVPHLRNWWCASPGETEGKYLPG